MSRRGPGSPEKMAVRMWALVRASPPMEGFDGGAGEADVFGGDGGEGDDAVVDFGEVAGAGDGEFVDALVFAVGALFVPVSPWTTKAWRVLRRTMASATSGTRWAA